jgi:hypothetical protein
MRPTIFWISGVDYAMDLKAEREDFEGLLVREHRETQRAI